MKEIELRSPRWEENPAPVLGMVRNYLLLDAGSEDPERKAAQSRAELLVEIRRRLAALPLERVLGLMRALEPSEPRRAWALSAEAGLAEREADAEPHDSPRGRELRARAEALYRDAARAARTLVRMPPPREAISA